MRSLLFHGALCLALVTALALPAYVSAQEADAPPTPPAEAKPAPAEAEPAPAPSPKAKSLDELLDFVKRGYSQEREENRLREERFRAAKDQQQALLEEALGQLRRAEARGEHLEGRFEENEKTLGEVTGKLDERTGNLGELFGVVRQVAGDMQSHVWESMTSSQLEDREAILSRLGRSKELPSTEDLEKLWYELHREITEQGKVVRYETMVLGAEGEAERKEVTRTGVFSVVAEGRYLLWDAAIQKLRELDRQPPARYLETVAPYEATEQGFARLAVDPSRGALLSALIETPNPTERIQQGGPVGYTIIGLGIFALLVGAVRWAALSITSRKVAAQKGREKADPGNPLGRVLGVYEDNRNADYETLELKLDEAVLRESSKVERLIWLVKVVSVVAPLLGLLGTVTGMIQTFQAITLFGAGDPKMMAGGISEALVTTMLGLTVAIPLVLLHAALSNSAKQVMGVLDEQSSGLVAKRAEAERV